MGVTKIRNCIKIHHYVKRELRNKKKRIGKTLMAIVQKQENGGSHTRTHMYLCVRVGLTVKLEEIGGVSK